MNKGQLVFQTSNCQLFEISFTHYRSARNSDEDSQTSQVLYVVSQGKMTALQVLLAFASKKKKALNAESIEAKNSSTASAAYTTRNRVYKKGRDYSIIVKMKTDRFGTKLAYLNKTK